MIAAVADGKRRRLRPRFFVGRPIRFLAVYSSVCQTASRSSADLDAAQRFDCQTGDFV